MKAKNRIDEINKSIEVLKNEITDLQNQCPHDEYHVGSYSWRVGSYDLMRICTDCYSILGMPSNNEIEDFNNEYDELNKESIEKGKNDAKEGNYIYIKPLRIGQGTKIYKNEKGV